MSKKIIAAIAIATSVFAMANTAEAGGKKRHGFHGGGHHQNYHGGHFRYNHGYNGHYRGCGYFKRKAFRTGSSYWWHKYQVCASRY